MILDANGKSAAPTLAPINIIRPDGSKGASEPANLGAELEARAERLVARMTPAEQLEAFEHAKGMRVSDQQRSLFFTAQIYKSSDLEKLNNAGRINMAPQGPRLFLRAIASEDASILGLAGEMAGGELDRDARRCIAHEVLGVGNGVERELDKAGVPDDTRDSRSILRRIRTWLSGRGVRPNARPRIGDHVFILSTVADRASKTDRNCRLWSVSCLDVAFRWTV